MYKIQKAKQSLKTGIKGYLLKDEEGKYIMKETARLPFYLEGPPGIGKTEIVSQIADEMNMGFVNFSITHHTRNSILGLPVIKDIERGKYTEYTMSEVIAKVYEAKEKGYNEGILLLDEFACVSETLLPTMLAFLQTKNIGMYSLPEGWVIVLCGNPPQYNDSARKFDAAILDRMRKLQIEFSFYDFINYAKDKNFHRSVIEYLELNQKDVYYCNSKDGNLELVTCRSWENLSHALYACEAIEEKVDRNLIGQFLKYDVIADKFYGFVNIKNSGVLKEDIDNILEGRNMEEYREMWKNKTVKFMWNVGDILLKNVEIEALKRNADNNDLSEKISNIFRLSDGMPKENSIKEGIYNSISKSKPMLKILSNVRNREYLIMSRKRYGLDTRR